MKCLIVSLALFTATVTQATWTTEKPLTAVLQSFDTKCAHFKVKGTDRKVDFAKAALGSLKLEPKKTEIQYLEASAAEHSCAPTESRVRE